MMAKVDYAPGPDDRYFMDDWNGYDVSRRRLLEAFAALPSPNAIVLTGGDGSDLPDNIKPVLAENPFVRFYNGQRGYVTCELTAKQARADFKVVEFVTERGAPSRTHQRSAGPRCADRRAVRRPWHRRPMDGRPGLQSLPRRAAAKPPHRTRRVNSHQASELR